MNIGVDIRGTEEMIRTLEALGPKATESLAGALFRQANYIMAESKRQVPVDTGALRASGFVELPEIDGGTVTVTMSYGGVAGGGAMDGEQGPTRPGEYLTNAGARDPSGYALEVHENLNAHHPVGKAKYLEDPFLEMQSGLLDRLGEDLQRDVL